jgi:hypothetical protein
MDSSVARLAKLDPRSVWRNEAFDFTPWLADNLDLLGEVLGMDLEAADREAPVGEFAADIVARDLNRDRIVIIENQLEPTDHAHLGQLITYAAGFDAAVVVWLSRELRDEHRQALDWLNRRGGGDTEFFGVVLELVQIDKSRPAVNFRLAAFPNAWSRETRGRPKLSDKRAAYQAFFQALIDELRTKHRFTNARVGQPQNWYSFATGITGIVYSASFAAGGRLRAEVYIDVGDGNLNRRIFEEFERDKNAIEAAFGGNLSWEALENRRACRIAVYRDDSSILDPAIDRDVLLQWTIDGLTRLKRVFGPRLRAAFEAASETEPAAEGAAGPVVPQLRDGAG